MNNIPKLKLLTSHQKSPNASSPEVAGVNQARRQIGDYCLGEPVPVVSSHSGAIDIAISLQEPAVFLPHVDSQSRSQSNQTDRADASSAVSQHQSQSSDTNLRSASVNSSLSLGSPSPAVVRPGLDRQSTSIERITESAQTQPRDTNPLFLNAQRLHTPIDSASDRQYQGGILRGSVVVKLAKPTKLKGVIIEFYGISKTLWNLVSQPTMLVDSPLPTSAQIEDRLCLGSHRWECVHLSQFSSSQYQLEKTQTRNSSVVLASDLYGADVASFRESASEVRYRKQFQMRQSPSAAMVASDTTAGESICLPCFKENQEMTRKLSSSTLLCEGVMYPAGEYVFNFNILLDANCSETAYEPNGSVRYFLSTRVVRSGPFTANVAGIQEILVVRSPPADLDALHQQPVNISRSWDERLVYSITLRDRHLTIDKTSRITLTLLPLPGNDVCVHQVRVYILETVVYLYSPDPSIKAADSSLKLVLFQKVATAGEVNGVKAVGNLLHPTEPTVIECPFTLRSKSDRPIQEIPQAYGRGKLGEKRYLQPDMTSRYVRVTHNLVLTLRVSKEDKATGKRNHFEVKVDTPVVLLSKLCTNSNVHLPQYTVLGADTPEHHENELLDDQDLPSFADALTHELVSPPTNIIPPADPKAQQLHIPALDTNNDSENSESGSSEQRH